jgi:WD repeat-containing protein 19
MGKHPRRICSGAWTAAANNLVLGSEDKTLTVSNENGDTLVHREVRYAPLEICVGFSSHSNPDGPARSSTGDSTIAANLGGRVLMLCSLDPSVEPLELSFDQQYGDLIKHCWLPGGLVALGFASGQLVILSTNMNDVREELYSSRVHPRGLTALAYNSKLKQVASAGPDGVRITEMTTFRELPNEFIPVSHLEGGTISSIGWSADGQILTIATSMGNVYNFVAKLPLVNARYKHACAYLSSLREVTVVDWTRRPKQITVPLRIEPAFIAMGGFHVAAGMNNKVYYHRISTDRHDLLVNDQEYLGAVTDVVMNDQFAAVLADGKVIVHPIELSRSHLGPQQNKVLPERTDGPYGEALCIAITDQFLYYGTRAGTLEVYYLMDQVLLVSVEKRLASPPRQIFPNIVDRKVGSIGSNVSGTKLVVVDENAACFLINPAADDQDCATVVPQSPVSIKTVLWDLKEQSTFSIFDGEGLHTYAYAPTTIHGPVVSKVGRIHISEDGAVLMDPEVVQMQSSLVPLVAIGGELTCQTAAGGLTTVKHPLFSSRYEEARTSTEMRLQESFEQHLAFLK